MIITLLIVATTGLLVAQYTMAKDMEKLKNETRKLTLENELLWVALNKKQDKGKMND